MRQMSSLSGRYVFLLAVLWLAGFGSFPAVDRAGQASPGAGLAPGSIVTGSATIPVREQRLDGPQDAREFEQWLDSFFERVLGPEYRPAIPGAVFILVKDGDVFLSKGYGFANLEAGQPFSTRQTTVRAASITKTFTALAIMQLVEQGKLSLSGDIRSYFPELNFGSTYPEPITPGDLLTHSAGLDETSFRYWHDDEVRRLAAFLVQEVPARVEVPGTLLTYSNYSYALAGRLVEIASGQSYAEYMDRHILQPLGMVSSSMVQPIPQFLLQRLTTGYTFQNGHLVPMAERLYRSDISAGGLTTTAEDMGRYLIAQLQLGRLGDTRVLGEDAARLMQAQHFANAPGLPGYTYGFYERFDNGRRTLMHGGGLRDAASLAVLLPEEQIGFFISINTPIELSSGGDPREELFRQFMNRYYPERHQAQVAFLPADPRLAGSYRLTRYVHRSIEKALKLDAPLIQATVRVDPDGTLTLSYPFDIVSPAHWKQIRPLVFQNVADPSDWLVFRENERGQITHLFGTLIQPFSLERIAWYETIPVQTGLLAASTLVFLAQAVWFPLAVATSWWRKRKWRLTVIPLIEWLMGLDGLGIVGALVIGNMTITGRPTVLIGLLITAGYGFGLMAGSLVVYGLARWRMEPQPIAARIGYVAVSLVAVMFAWFMSYWNIIG
jgi:CubicO group peptidase (beta-lactamase class C family)